MRNAIKSVLFRRSERTVIDECRRCGTTVGSPGACCPECGCTDIVSYRIQ